MAALPPIAVIGDVHLRFDDEDVRYFNASDYGLILFVGDLAGYRRGVHTVARRSAVGRPGRRGVLAGNA